MSNAPHLVIYIDNSGAEDLEVTKVYRRLEDEEAERDGFFRVIDDSGEDYLYPRGSFRPLPLPSSIEQELEDVALSRLRGRPCEVTSGPAGRRSFSPRQLEI